MRNAIKNLGKKLLGKPLYNSVLQRVFLCKNPEFYGEALKNRELKNAYRGKRCFIIGNGPSLKDVDFDLLKHEFVFTVNQLPRNPDYGKLRSDFHIWADQRFFDIDPERREDAELLDVMRSVNSGESKPIVFYKWPAKKMIDANKMKDVLDIRYFGDIGLDIGWALGKRHPLDITKPLPIFSTVVHYAVCIAAYMGFQEIVLLGCDCTGFVSTAHSKMSNAQLSEYAYTISDNEKKRLERIWSQTSIKDELRWYIQIFDTYDLLLAHCGRLGVKLYNATSETLIENIPRVELTSYLRGKV